MSEMSLIDAEIPLFEPFPGYQLAKARKSHGHIQAGQYVLTDGHRPIMVFPEDPSIEPVIPDNDDDCDSENNDEWQVWMTAATNFADYNKKHIPLDPLEGYNLVEASIRAGYMPDLDGIWAVWLFERIGKMLAGEAVETEWKGKGIHLYPVLGGQTLQVVKDGDFARRVNITQSYRFQMKWEIDGQAWKIKVNPIQEDSE